MHGGRGTFEEPPRPPSGLPDPGKSRKPAQVPGLAADQAMLVVTQVPGQLLGQRNVAALHDAETDRHAAGDRRAAAADRRQAAHNRDITAAHRGQSAIERTLVTDKRWAELYARARSARDRSLP